MLRLKDFDCDSLAIKNVSSLMVCGIVIPRRLDKKLADRCSEMSSIHNMRHELHSHPHHSILNELSTPTPGHKGHFERHISEKLSFSKGR